MAMTAGALRRVLDQLIRSDSDLEAFCIDYFPDVQRRLTNGLDRVAKVNLLLSHADLAAVQAALVSTYPGEAPALLATLQPPPPPPSAAPVAPAPVRVAEPPPVPPAGPEDPALGELRQRFREGQVVIFAGAGISLAAGLPSWPALVARLREHPRAREASAEAQAEIDGLVEKRMLIDALSAIEACLGRPEMCVAIEKALDDGPIVEVPEPARAIAELAPRLRAVLTTNLDRLLERAFAGRWPTFARATADVVQRSRYILKLHGSLEDRATWVLTRAEYDRALHADPLLRRAFEALYASSTLLFVGYGLADDDLEPALGWTRAFAAAQAPRHFALLPSGGVGPLRRRLLEDAGVRVIEYPTPGGSHDEVVRVLRSLA